MIAATGSIGLDTTRTPFKTVERVLGGSASYFSYCASFFDKVGLVSVVGEDFPEKYWRELEAKGVDLKGVQRNKGKTFHFDSSFSYDL
ncbi:sugar kinase, partial [Candidatus Micrarchaeota archaeon CG10_big_fil_rev_8_21_14_0_10_60_32]